MRVQRLSNDPEVLLLHDFVTPDEAESLIREAEALFSRSPTVCDDPGGCFTDQRTSSSAALPVSTTTNAIQTRGRSFSRLPVAEAVQVVRYEPGQRFEPHLDAFGMSSGDARALAQYEGRQRVATILIYLGGPDDGGQTTFPELGLRVDPIPRAALYWRNVKPDGSIDSRTLHGGDPVRLGTKYAANLWLRGDQDPVYAYAVSENVDFPEETQSSGKTAAILALGVGVGAAIAGPSGAILGGVMGWTVDAVRRRIR